LPGKENTFTHGKQEILVTVVEVIFTINVILVTLV
jgi:hypothetical protein